MNFFYPDFETFKELSKAGNLIPVSCRLLADTETPLSTYQKFCHDAQSFLFESVEGGEHVGRYSFLGSKPREIIIQKGDTIEVIKNGNTRETFMVSSENPDKRCNVVKDVLEVIERELKEYKPVIVSGLPRFTGGAVGYLGYEFIHNVEPVVPKPQADELQLPTAYFMITDELVIFDRVTQTIILLVNTALNDFPDPESAYASAKKKINKMIELFSKPCNMLPVLMPYDTPEIPVESNIKKEQFIANVNKAKKYITAGDIIQVVGSQRFSTKLTCSALDVYRFARTINPSPYMFMLNLGDFSLVGASPEIHVRCEDRNVEIRPIAGTRKRGKTNEEDIRNEQELLNDPKERAEHVMLVDLARNDLGRVCDFGTVHVKDLMVVERYSHVMHIVSQVNGRLSGDKTVFDLMRATFPAGTLSGAPKIRAMQIIAELENTQRGPYGGCVGYFSFNGNLDCCITIRTAVIKEGKAYVQAGGGWVADSEPEAEFQETVNKAKAMLKAIALAENCRNISNLQV